MWSKLFSINFFAILLLSLASCDVIDFTQDNIDSVLKANELVLVDFYASWCYFSNILDPIFTEASTKIDALYKDKGKAVLGKVDCEKETEVAKKYGIRKYPTIKVFRYGEVSRQEYRGARNVAAFVEFVNDQLVDALQVVDANADIPHEVGESHIIAYLKSKDNPHFQTISRLAKLVKQDCKIYAKINPETPVEKLEYISMGTSPISFLDLNNAESMKSWVVKSCTPIVRNITFQNAEDITEEGRPLVLLFYNPSEPGITAEFTKLITDHLTNEAATVNFVYADGIKFSHPLMHLGKTQNDLPLIAVDSFQHMFLLQHSVAEALKNPDILKKFVEDLHSGKLHREFHNGPDPVNKPEENQSEEDKKSEEIPAQVSTPFPSVFKKLRPNSNRYSMHDEF